MRFIFRLERLLDLRRRNERSRAQALGEAMAAERRGREEKDRAVERLERIGEQVKGQDGKVTPAGSLAHMHLAVRAVARELETAEDAHRAAEASVGDERERYGEARIERRTIEKLREGRFEKHRVEDSRREQSENDEIARRTRKGTEDIP